MTAFLALMFLGCATVASAQTAKSADDTREANLREYVDLLRSDVRAEKTAILTEMMAFTEDEDKAFWPIYRDYDRELTALHDERVKIILDYAAHYGAMTDADADRLAHGALGLEDRRQALKAKLYDRVKAALSAKQAARVLQIENQLLMLIDLQIAASLPIIE